MFPLEADVNYEVYNFFLFTGIFFKSRVQHIMTALG